MPSGERFCWCMHEASAFCASFMQGFHLAKRCHDIINSLFILGYRTFVKLLCLINHLQWIMQYLTQINRDDNCNTEVRWQKYIPNWEHWKFPAFTPNNAIFVHFFLSRGCPRQSELSNKLSEVKESRPCGEHACTSATSGTTSASATWRNSSRDSAPSGRSPSRPDSVSSSLRWAITDYFTWIYG